MIQALAETGIHQTGCPVLGLLERGTTAWQRPCRQMLWALAGVRPPLDVVEIEWALVGICLSLDVV